MRLLIPLALLCSLAAPAWAATPGPARAELDRFGENINNLTARFVQQVYDDSDNALDSASGTLALARPNRFRWDYLKPE